MINPKELRIGNIIRFIKEMKPRGSGDDPDDPNSGGPFQIVYGTVDRIQMAVYSIIPGHQPIGRIWLDGFVSGTEGIHPERLCGVELTSEILEKCGFIKGRYTYQDGSFHNEAFIQKGGRYIITKINVGSLKEPDEYYSMQYFPYPQSQNSIGARLTYLHQLQNLYFALTEQELEIRL